MHVNVVVFWSIKDLLAKSPQLFHMGTYEIA